jgi:hypothetical protein
VPKLRGGVCRGARRKPESTVPVPDLTGVDLRILRTLDGPELRAAVEDVLCFPERLVEIWGSDTKEG